jgi:uncharacterized protein with ParB-like and HNH nuclease domain
MPPSTIDAATLVAANRRLTSKESLMKAVDTNLQSILEGTKQFLVPLFQRTYSWDKKEWDSLWSDLEDLYDEQNPREHFIGSTVTIPSEATPSGVTKFLLIDGQQRLTTIFILLANIRNLAIGAPDSTLADEINNLYLTNQYKKGPDHWKLVPTQADRAAFDLLMKNEIISENTQIGKASSYFAKRLAAKNAPALETLSSLVVSKLVLVDIVLNHDEDPYLIFESLNAKGRPLSQGDLIRNYFFMNIKVEEQQHVYDTYWEPMQEQLGDSLTEFIRHFLMRGGDNVRQVDVYQALKRRAENKSHVEMISYLQEIARFATFYSKLLQPTNEHCLELRERMSRLNRVEVTVAYPFLLNVYDDYDAGRISTKEFSEVMDVLENFMVRRAVCAVPTNQLNRIFPPLYAQAVKEGTLVEGVKVNLAARNYPRDAEFRERFVASRMYGTGGRASRSKLILERLELSVGSKEVVPFDNLSVEHVMPQTLTTWWKQHLGEQFEQSHDLLLHTIGNLTLTAYNSELSNAEFTRKKEHFLESNIGLNKWFSGLDEWNDNAIRNRAESLADRALKIWPYFGVLSDEMSNEKSMSVTGKVPTELIILGQRIPVTSWREVEQQTFQAISELDFDEFKALVAKFPRFVALEEVGFRSPRQLTNGYFIETNLSASAIYRVCVQAAESAGLSSDEWHVETA